MNETKLGELRRALGLDEGGSDVAVALREMTKQHELAMKIAMQTQAANMAVFERVLLARDREVAGALQKMMAMFTPQALKLSATLDRAAVNAGAPARPTGANPVSPDDGVDRGFVDEEGANREVVDMEKILADTRTHSGAAFHP